LVWFLCIIAFIHPVFSRDQTELTSTPGPISEEHRDQSAQKKLTDDKLFEQAEMDKD
jgi:hypothetical protein